jgi:alkanesulfonate monooxygenase SsuD/methylene tetrahydromethanopterin reductase-like flavin-dependent oxidoreductase (luciferase family)
VTDGPFAEAREQLGGLLLLEAKDMPHAIERMSKHPGPERLSSSRASLLASSSATPARIVVDPFRPGFDNRTQLAIRSATMAGRRPKESARRTDAVELGIFMEEARPDVSAADAFREKLDLAQAADAWGVHGVWLGEIHFSPGRSVCSVPNVVGAAIATTTRRIRVGTAVQVLPLHHPLRIAEEVATLDQLSEGRVDFGVGRSTSPRAYDVLGIPYEESQARFREALDVIVQAWKGEPFSYAGQFYRFDNVAVSPPPYQTPHPPIRMAATTPETFPLVGAMGLHIWVGLRGMDIPELQRHVAAYRRAWHDAGHAGAPDVYLRIPIYAAPTDQEALDEPRESIIHYIRRQADVQLAGAGRDAVANAHRRTQAERMRAMSYEDILQTRVAFGSPGRLIERLAELREALDLKCIVAELNPGALIPVDRVKRTLRILTHQVMPALS